MVIRLPRAECYTSAIRKERAWLPVFTRSLSLRIPIPIAKGEPSDLYPWPWSVNRWIEGETLRSDNISSMSELAFDLVNFLRELQTVSTERGVLAGEQNFHRGGDLRIYEEETLAAISKTPAPYTKDRLTSIWQEALANPFAGIPVWVHGDVAADNLIIRNGKLYGVIDFGTCGVGDPSCDLVTAWNFFDRESRRIFLQEMQADAAMIARARGWAYGKL